MRAAIGVLGLLAMGVWSHQPVERNIGRLHASSITHGANQGIQLVARDAFAYRPYERAEGLADGVSTATFVVRADGFPPEAEAAFQYALAIWADTVVSTVPIQVHARFGPLPDRVLGVAGPSGYFDNFPNVPWPNTFYADAVADRLYGADLCAVPSLGCEGVPDIDASFTSTPPAPWYFGIDARPPAGTIDFVSVALHELGHGLGFLGSADAHAEGTGVWGLGAPARPISYDRYVRNAQGAAFIANPTPSGAAYDDLTGGSLFFVSPALIDTAGRPLARLFAPARFRAGSTFSHLDETSFPTRHPDSLMTPSIATAEANHNPGPITRQILADLGWARWVRVASP